MFVVSLLLDADDPLAVKMLLIQGLADRGRFAGQVQQQLLHRGKAFEKCV